jgi:hypothetical protein
MKKILTLLALGVAGTLQAQTTSPTPYCNGEFDDPTSVVPIAIKSVSFSTLTNLSGGQYAAPHYVFYNNLTVPDLNQGATVPIQIGYSVIGNASGWGVWIDFNQNNTFEASEKVAGSTGTSYLSSASNAPDISASMPIPANALVGNTRMRVRIVDDNAYSAVNGANIEPCNAGTTAADIMDWGETEDYTVNIVSGGTPPPNPNGLDFSANRTVGFTNTNFTLSDNNFKNPTARRWIFTPNKVVYQAATNEGAARPIVRFADTGTYSVKLITTFAGGKDSVERAGYIRINPFPAGVAQVEAAAFNLFPNPATGIVNFTLPLQNASVVIYDVTGTACYQNAQFSGSQLNMNALAEGVYFLRITQAGETFLRKVVLKK